MRIQTHSNFLIFLLLISFASVNAVMFTPGLPAITHYFKITDGTAQLTISLFLVGYAIGQLLYGPIANRYGRKPALSLGILLQIISSLICASSSMSHSFAMLVIGRIFMAIGSGVGLKMTFTLVNELYEQKIAAQQLSYLMIAFAITPSISVMLGGFLNTHFNWQSAFYTCALYGCVLLFLTSTLPETKQKLDLNALKYRQLLGAYLSQFKNSQLMRGGILMGLASSFIYLFAAMAPFIAMNIMHMNATSYGTANLLPSTGLILGSVVSAQLDKKFHSTLIVKLGITIALAGSITMLALILMKFSPLLTLFFPMTMCYVGLALIFTHASALAMQSTKDKAHGSAVMNFINMGLVTLMVLCVSTIPIHALVLPLFYIGICALMYGFGIKI